MQEQIALLTARGTRLDEATTGHGLGLSIVKEICEQYGFILKFNRSETLQGLNVSILINP
jgi:signal transduction histidine kinase